MNDRQTLNDDLLKIVLGTVAVAGWLENHGIPIAGNPWLGWLSSTDTTLAVFGGVIYLAHKWRASRLGQKVETLIEHRLDRLDA